MVKPTLVLMRKSTFDKYDPLFQLLEESYHVSDFSPWTNKKLLNSYLSQRLTK